jgi:hypothetical protein
MSLNLLTGKVGLMVTPLCLKTLAKHYSERLIERITPAFSDTTARDGEQGTPKLEHDLRRESLVYDQIFTTMKVSFLPVRFHNPIVTFVPVDCVLHDKPSLIFMISSHHFRLVSSSIFCQLLLGEWSVDQAN